MWVKPGDFFSLIGAMLTARAYQHPRRDDNKYSVAGEKKLFKLFFFKARSYFLIERAKIMQYLLSQIYLYKYFVMAIPNYSLTKYKHI